MKNVNKKGLCWRANIARHRFAHGKVLSCCFCRCGELNFGYVDGQTCRFCKCKVGIRFDSNQVGCETAALFVFGVYSLQNLVFLTASGHIPADNPAAEIRWG